MTSRHTILVESALEMLAINKFFTWGNNTGALKAPTGFVRYGQKGSADILGCLPDGRFLGAEAKVKPDKQKSDQKIFQKMLEKNGGLYILFYSLEELSEGLRKEGHGCPVHIRDNPR